MACVPPGVNRLATARSSFLPTIEATAAASSRWACAHVLAVLGRLVEAGAGAGVGQVAPDAEPLQPVEHLLGLRERQQHRAVVAHMHEVVRRERVARLDGASARLRPSARRQKMTPGGIVGFGCSVRGDGKGAERQALRARPDAP